MELKEGYKQTELGFLPVDWSLSSYISFGEIIDGDRGQNYPKVADFNNFGYCLFLDAGNVTKRGFQFVNCQFISQKKDKSLNKGKLERNDIVLTTRGTLGNFGFYHKNISYEHVRINSGMVILRNCPCRRF